MTDEMSTDNKAQVGGPHAVDLKSFPERPIATSGVIWQALAAVIDGMDDEEAEARLEALNPEELRTFHFQLDRIRTLTRNVRFRKMRAIDDAEKMSHEAGVRKPEGEEETTK